MSRTSRCRMLPAVAALLLAAPLAPLSRGADAEKKALDLSKLPPAAARTIDFDREVKPLLVDRCVNCHGEKKHEGGLRLNGKKDALAGGDNGAVIEPGKGDKSRLIHLTAGLDPDEIMPPEGKGKPLTPEQVGVLRAWIDQGAVWPEASGAAVAAGSSHWAYQKPVRREPPAVKQAGWVRNPIDNFILARLEKEGLSPSPEASKETLIRRVALDLTGLPPEPGEVDAFLKDAGPDAYAKMVDRYLASPAYGERQCRPWLDLARYADTHGYERDHLRTMWPWRDWVINAFNKDMPFDQFTIEQIAGDLLPNATPEQKMATGFHRNAMLNSEDGSDDEEWRVVAVVDRVNTTGSVWLGTTIGCAQCHTHKYDPFKQKEYYQLFAFFNSTADGGNANKNAGPDLEVPVPNLGDPKAAGEIVRLEAQLAKPTPAITAAQAAWEKVAAQDAEWQVVEDAEFSAASGSKGTRQPDGSFLVSGQPVGQESYTVKGKTTLTGITGVRLEVLPDASLPSQGPGRAPNGNFVLSGFKLAAGSIATLVPLQNPRADVSQPEYAVTDIGDANPRKGWGILPATGQPHAVTWETQQDVNIPAGEPLTFTLDQRYGDGHTIGRFRLAVTRSDRSRIGSVLPPAIRTILAIDRAARSAQQKTELATYYATIAPELKPIRTRLAALRGTGPKTAKVLVMQELKEPRKTNVMLRGNFQSLGDPVQPGVPESLNPLPPGAPRNRLGLARWLVDPSNPLTARVAVNRFWEQAFGRGIVLTSEDFGTKGEPPTHPELLDWLATEFMRQGWSMKAMHRLIVNSATYRQDSRVTPELIERDPYNRLLAHGPRVRLDAETIRDQALAVAGLLSHKMGGPPVMPPQPDGVWNRPYSGLTWVTSKGEDRYRRALYTFWRRTAAYPAMATFDAPSREQCTVRRPRTNTPLQALTILNDPAYVEAAQGLARRVLSATPKSAEDRIAYAFRLCLARAPELAERERLVDLLNRELENYRAHPDAAKALIDESALGAPSAEMNVSELAAWTVVGNVLLNLDETITKG